jgi:hypothetical protein
MWGKMVVAYILSRDPRQNMSGFGKNKLFSRPYFPDGVAKWLFRPKEVLALLMQKRTSIPCWLRGTARSITLAGQGKKGREF